MDADGRAYINQTAVPMGELPARLREALAGQTDQLLYFAADGELGYDTVTRFMDLCVEAGGKDLGIVFEELAVSR